MDGAFNMHSLNLQCCCMFHPCIWIFIVDQSIDACNHKSKSICPPSLCVLAVCMYAHAHAHKSSHDLSSCLLSMPCCHLFQVFPVIFIFCTSNLPPCFHICCVAWGVACIVCVCVWWWGGGYLGHMFMLWRIFNIWCFFFRFYLFTYMFFWTSMVENGGVTTSPPSPPPFVDSHRDVVLNLVCLDTE